MLIGVEKGRKPKRCSLLPPKLKLRGKLVGGKETRGDREETSRQMEAVLDYSAIDL